MQDLARRFNGFELRASARNVKRRGGELPLERPSIRRLPADRASERGRDVVHQAVVARLHGRRVAIEQLPVAPDQELLEVPLDVAGMAVRRVGEPRVQRMAAGAVDVEFPAHREGHAVGRRAEGLDLRLGAGFLRAELVAGKPDDREVLARELLVEALEVGVLRRKAAAARDVHGEHDLALERAQEVTLAADSRQVEVEERWHVFPPGGLRDDGRERPGRVAPAGRMVVLLADVAAVEAPLVAEARLAEAFVVPGVLEKVFLAGETGAVNLPATLPVDLVAQSSHGHLLPPTPYRSRGQGFRLSPRDFRTCRKAFRLALPAATR